MSYLENSDPLLGVSLVARSKVQVDLGDDLIAGPDPKFSAPFRPLQDLCRAPLLPPAVTLQGLDVESPGAVGEGPVAVEVLEGLDGTVGGLDGRREDEGLLLVDGPENGDL